MRFASFDPEKVALLNKEFVPVLLNSFYGYNSGWFKREDFMGGLWKDVRNGNGVWTVLKPDGTYLDKEVERGWNLWRSLPAPQRRPGAFAVVPVTERHPGAPPSGPPPGALLVQSNQRNLKRSASGGYSLLTAENTRAFGTAWNPKYNDSFEDVMWVLEEEWKALVPPDPKTGDRFPLPDRFKKRLLLWHLTNRTFCVGIAWDERDVRSEDLSLRVEEVSPLLRLRLEGSVLLKMDGTAEDKKIFWGRTEHGYEARVLGFLDYDPARRSFSRFDIVSVGDYWGGDCEGGRHDVGRLPLAIGFGLGRPGTIRDRILPCGGVGLERYLALKPQH